MNLNHVVALGILIFYTALVTCACYLVWGRQTIEVVEAPAAPVWHDDGGLTPIRAADGDLKLKPASAPKGGELLRTVEFTVKPKPIPADKVAEHTNEAGEVECSPVTVRADTHEFKDGPDLGLRTSLRADGGEFLDGVEVPHTSVFVRRETTQVVGLSRIGDTTTVTYQRSFGALDIGPAAIFPDGQRPTFGGALNFRF